ncbi:hypothetical protein KVT40_004377 [Elsinoe batatas]|uniref:Uncharacterized protein n=1 Tax=Elsinoe batatas TaxID=2601811 RepID=A0A8K0L2K1_9PEZI|nr:hypothetical protein KVT40_004377 [Elsinoe batatas]
MNSSPQITTFIVASICSASRRSKCSKVYLSGTTVRALQKMDFWPQINSLVQCRISRDDLSLSCRKLVVYQGEVQDGEWIQAEHQEIQRHCLRVILAATDRGNHWTHVNGDIVYNVTECHFDAYVALHYPAEAQGVAEGAGATEAATSSSASYATAGTRSESPRRTSADSAEQIWGEIKRFAGAARIVAPH